MVGCAMVNDLDDGAGKSPNSCHPSRLAQQQLRPLCSASETFVLVCGNESEREWSARHVRTSAARTPSQRVEVIVLLPILSLYQSRSMFFPYTLCSSRKPSLTNMRSAPVNGFHLLVHFDQQYLTSGFLNNGLTNVGQNRSSPVGPSPIVECTPVGII
ncbi:uncharacterized protein K460DRAFT_56516 [Cucurbitaria berberidis CBS 394.84]|uniref:Uncharacterized protein n=1 Tax=Cucurbitaria berberidis CBS 394.84 TaxID=1168544 RepID=A0A9P4GKU7_9PLEO|nr:uncharacterized protein K460DRAFT_56516 [Cucurbitaria berberidis CBS 394.84]KAF1847304.1 hypothetical protein K460DRAFT_56516 [Cucurbitaria berberidis CBS 394.84]